MERERAGGCGRAAACVGYRQNVGTGGLSDPWPAARRDRQRHQPRASHADEETASRPRGVDVSRGPYQRSQGNSSPPPSLRYSTNTTISGSCVLTHPIVVLFVSFSATCTECRCA